MSLESFELTSWIDQMNSSKILFPTYLGSTKIISVELLGMEEWRAVTDYPNYFVSTLGRIKRRERFLKLSPNEAGYYRICLSKNGLVSSHSVARLVAGAFIPPVEGKLTVDHIDRVRTNNHVSNLRWANGTEQCLNRDIPLGATGQKHITRQQKWFKVQIKRNRQMLYTRLFTTLEEAMEARDQFIYAFSHTAAPETLTDAPELPPLPSSFPLHEPSLSEC